VEVTIKAEEVSTMLAAVVFEADAVVKAIQGDQAIKDHSMEVKAALYCQKRRNLMIKDRKPLLFFHKELFYFFIVDVT